MQQDELKAQSLPGLSQQQSTPSLAGSVALFLTFIPFALATALQYDNVQTALIVGTATAGGMVLFGLLFYSIGARQGGAAAMLLKVPVQILDVAILVTLAVQLGISYQSLHYHDNIRDYFNFITNGLLGLISLATLVIHYPFTLQYIRETVPKGEWRQGSIKSASVYSTVLFVVVFITNALIYLVPVAKSLLGSPSDPLNYVFRIILPILLFLAAAITTRMLPLPTSSLLLHSTGFDGSDIGSLWRMGPGPPPPAGITRVMVNPLSQP